ncbi:MAG: hypothetical protein ABEJ56_05480 [Candidatus Nanohaloarchaea archaeon]
MSADESWEKRSREAILDLKSNLSQNFWKASGISLLLILGMILTDLTVAILLLVMTASVSILTNSLKISWTGVEIATFSTVLLGYVIGPSAGALFGLAFILVQVLSGSTPGFFMVWSIPGYIAAGYAAGIFTGIEIAVLGPVISGGLHLFFLSMTAILMGSELPRYLRYAGLNFVFNLLIFRLAGSPAVELLHMAGL